MRRPHIHRNVSAGIVIVCVAAIVAAFRLADIPENTTLQIILGVGGFTLGIFALIYALEAAGNARRYARVMRGEGLIARWSVEPHRYRAFEALVDADAKLADGAIDVVVGSDVAVVDGNVQSIMLGASTRLSMIRLVDGAVPYIDFTMRTQTKTGSTTWPFRVPIGEGAGHDALRVYEHYRGLLSTAEVTPLIRRRPQLVRRVALVVAVLAAAAGISGYAMQEPASTSEPAVALMIVGIMVTPIALIFALAAHVKARRTHVMPPPARRPATEGERAAR